MCLACDRRILRHANCDLEWVPLVDKAMADKNVYLCGFLMDLWKQEKVLIDAGISVKPANRKRRIRL
jgi:hypothetical protein